MHSNKINLGILFLLAGPLFAAEIEYQGRINIAEFESKTVRHNYCIFSSGDSNTDTDSISSAASGNSNSHYETYSHRGQTYLRRKVEWTNEETANGMVLSFVADDAHFRGEQNYNKTHCTYKTWKGQSTSANTVLTAKTAFQIPANVWAIKIKARSTSDGGLNAIDLANEDYVKVDGADVLTRKSFFKFGNDTVAHHFLVNPSFEEKDNFVFLDFKYVSNTLNQNTTTLDFDIEFIAAEQCLTDLNGLNFADVLARKVKDNDLENALVNMACMLNTNYIQHNLGVMHLNGLGDLFIKLKAIEKEITDKNADALTASDLESMGVVLQLIDRVRFYYAYEIVKETMGMLLSPVEYQGQKINSWMYLEVLRRRGVLYLYDIFDNLSATMKKLKDPQTPFILIPANAHAKFDVFLNLLLPVELKSFAKAHELIYRPTYLASASFSNLNSSVQRVLRQSDVVLNTSRLIFMAPEASVAQVDNFEAELRLMAADLRQYSQQIEKFKIELASDSASDVVAARRQLLNQIESIYQLNLVKLSEIVGTYFNRHFEDPQFKKISVQGKQYASVGEFIADFQRLMKEVP
jgi:hypothetical protein